MNEPVPLHRVHEAIFEFCKGRPDAVVFGAQAVNLHVDVPRMTQDVDILSQHPAELARELSEFLHQRLQLATRVREVSAGKGFRVYQVRKQGNRHLADVRLAELSLDDCAEQDGIRYTSLVTTVALKVIAYTRRTLAPKGATDLADLRRLLLAHRELRDDPAPVSAAIERAGGTEEARAAWHDLARAPLVSDQDTDEGY